MANSRPIQRIVVVMFENQYRHYVLQDPFLSALAGCGADMRNYFGVFHPSQTNYVASLAGELCGVTNDEPPGAVQDGLVTPLAQRNLVDLLEEAQPSISWKAYMEGYPGETWNPAWKAKSYPQDLRPLVDAPAAPALARYFRKHNAFASFHTIQAQQKRWERIVDEWEFWRDLCGGQLPEYSWFTPDIWNDGHYLTNTHIDTDPRTQLVPQISGWLEHVFLGSIEAGKLQGAVDHGFGKTQLLGLGLDVELLRSDPARAWQQSRVPAGTLIVVTFDEADFDATSYDTNYDGPNQIYTVLLGDMIPPGTVIETPFNHYSLLKTVERNFGTNDLGKNDRGANWFRFLWKESFAWSQGAEVRVEGQPLAPPPGLALAGCDGVIELIHARAAPQGVGAASLRDGAWASAPAPPFAQVEALALAAVDDETLIAAAVSGPEESRELTVSVRSRGSWGEPSLLVAGVGPQLALCGYFDPADGRHKAMLCWQGADDLIRYWIYADGWQAAPGEVGQRTDGPLTLAQLGPSLFLVYKEYATRRLRMSSFNLACFNEFAAKNFEGHPAPNNDTSRNRWAPADVPVGHFAQKFAALQDDYQALGPLAMASIEGEMHLVHRGAYRDTPQVSGTVFGLTGVLTAARWQTNGYGTLAQAGWTPERPLPGVTLKASDVGADPPGNMALASDGRTLTLVWQNPGAPGTLRYQQGTYR